jgi:hypothetical protein
MPGSPVYSATNMGIIPAIQNFFKEGLKAARNESVSGPAACNFALQDKSFPALKKMRLKENRRLFMVNKISHELHAVIQVADFKGYIGAQVFNGAVIQFFQIFQGLDFFVNLIQQFLGRPAQVPIVPFVLDMFLFNHTGPDFFEGEIFPDGLPVGIIGEKVNNPVVSNRAFKSLPE